MSDVGYSARSHTTFLNFGGRYPNHDFTAVIFRAAESSFPDAQKWLGATLRVTGRVQLYRGKPEIILNDPKQVDVRAGSWKPAADGLEGVYRRP